MIFKLQWDSQRLTCRSRVRAAAPAGLVPPPLISLIFARRGSTVCSGHTSLVSTELDEFEKAGCWPGVAAAVTVTPVAVMQGGHHECDSGPLCVVLVHGAFVDGSSWRAVYDLLTADGYRVAVAQNPTLSLADDVAATRRIIDAQDGPVVLVGHSYGGAVITEAGTHSKVTALVYVAAFVPDRGESVQALGGEPDTAGSPIVRAAGGFMFQDQRGSTRRSALTCPPGTPYSWPTPRSRGAWAP